MKRYFHDARQQLHAGRYFSWLHMNSTKKLAIISVVASLAISYGFTLPMDSPSAPIPPKPQTISSTTNTTPSHPLLDLDGVTSLPSLQETPKPQANSLPDSQNSVTDDVTSWVMHQTTLTINGESIEIPPSGSSHQTLKNQDGTQTQVNIQHDQTQVDGIPRSNITIDSRTKSNNASTSLNSRITITH